MFTNGDRPLRVGVLKTNNFFDVTSSCLRAVDLAADELKKQGTPLHWWRLACTDEASRAGHTLVEFEEINVMEMVELFYSLVAADGGETVLEALRGQVGGSSADIYYPATHSGAGH